MSCTRLRDGACLADEVPADERRAPPPLAAALAARALRLQRARGVPAAALGPGLPRLPRAVAEARQRGVVAGASAAHTSTFQW